MANTELNEAQKEAIAEANAHLNNAALPTYSELQAIIKSLLVDVAPHTRETGHNAADRDMAESIKNARAVLIG
jgi:hypothetical protein